MFDDNKDFLLPNWAWAAIAVATAILAVIAFAAGVNAQETSPTAVPILPFYKIIEPYLVIFITTLVSGFFTWLSTLTAKFLNLKITAALQAELEKTASNAATHAFAQLEGPIGDMAIEVGSPLVVMAAKYIEDHAQDEIEKLGLTPQYVQQLALAKLGEVQIHADVGDPSSPAMHMAGKGYPSDMIKEMMKRAIDPQKPIGVVS